MKKASVILTVLLCFALLAACGGKALNFSESDFAEITKITVSDLEGNSGEISDEEEFSQVIAYFSSLTAEYKEAVGEDYGKNNIRKVVMYRGDEAAYEFIFMYGGDIIYENKLYSLDEGFADSFPALFKSNPTE